MKQTDIGIFLHRTSFSESSIVATFYTQEKGIQKFIFQGAKKKNNVLFPLNICELTFYKRPDSELSKLTQAEMFLPLNAIAFEPLKGIVAFFIADVLKQTLHTNEKEERQFNFLKNTIVELDESNELTLFPLRFLVEYADFLGISPIIPDDDPLYFNLNEGEFHSDYRPGELCEEGIMVKHLCDLFKYNTIPNSYRKQCLEMMLNYYKMHIPRFDVSSSLEIIREVLM